MVPGDATLPLVQFNMEDLYEVVRKFTPIGDVPLLTRETYVSRSTELLLDVLGRGIDALLDAWPLDFHKETVVAFTKNPEEVTSSIDDLSGRVFRLCG